MSKSKISQVNVHPLVLLSIVDHFNRVNMKQRSKRVVGALLGSLLSNSGETNGDKIEVVNCYGIPFEEDPSQSNIWFLDHLYHETMFLMMKKVLPIFKIDQSEGKILRVVHHWIFFQIPRYSNQRSLCQI